MLLIFNFNCMTKINLSNDTLQRFLFENISIRGELTQLNKSWQAIIENHDYPPVVRDVLAQMLVAGVLLAATLKFKGRIILQIQGNGTLPLVVAECTSEQAIRGLAHYKGDVTEASLKTLVGDGQLAITLETENKKERYQSIVELVGNSVADAIEHYLEISEQLSTRLWLSSNNNAAAGLLIQKLPHKSVDEENIQQVEQDEDGWNRVEQLSATIKDEELLNLDAQELMHRLYHEEDLRIFNPEPVFFRCPCSKDKVANMLRSLGHKEVKSILEEKEIISIACEFCNHDYQFDAVDAEQLFIDSIVSDNSPTQH